MEEDAASELVYEGEKLPPIKAFDTLENVIYIYSFSLTFVTGLSIAVVAANADVIRSLSYLVSVRLMASDWMTQKLLGRYLDDGTYYKALDEFRASYSRKQRLVCEKLDEMAALGVSYERPRGGVYIWCRLPDGGGQQAVHQPGLQHGPDPHSGLCVLPVQERRAELCPHQLLL